MMKILKFGGTSVGSAERMKKVADLIIRRGRGNVVVLSAMSGTTNSLLEISDYYAQGNRASARAAIQRLRAKYIAHIEQLYSTAEVRKRVADFLEGVWRLLQSFAQTGYAEQAQKQIVAQGEIMSTNMMTAYLQERGAKAVLISALDFMRTDSQDEPDMTFIRSRFLPILEANKEADVIITQGFICQDADGRLSNLHRGGSDYTASLLGAAAKAEIIEIWTDIDGMHTSDPRFVEGTRPVHQLHFEEAAELAYFGAKILHPTCILPAKFAGIPVRLLNTMEPEAEGTLINNHFSNSGLKAMAAKDGITVIKIVSGRMLLARGFLRKIFEIFETHQTSIDMVTTSEVGVSITIDDPSHLDDIQSDLRRYGTVETDRDMCIICVVGDLRLNQVGIEGRVAQAMGNIPIRMISYGGSNHNISFVVPAAYKQQALQTLHSKLFVND